MYDGDNALLSAVRTNNVGIVRMLLNHGTDCNTQIYSKDYISSFVLYDPHLTLEEEKRVWYNDILRKSLPSVKATIELKSKDFVFVVMCRKFSIAF